MTRSPCLGIPFDDGRPEEIREKAIGLIGLDRAAYVVTPNPEIVMASWKDPVLREAILAADLILPDGVGLLWASKILGTPLRNRLPGIDFASAMLAELAGRQGSVFLLGAKPDLAPLAGKKLAEQFPGLRIAGTQHGFYTQAEEKTILEQIRRSRPELLFVCLGSPRQELWMKKHGTDLPGVLMIGLGGALDVYAGRIRRAPPSWRRLGFEWLWRLLHEPKRIKRVIRLPAFLWAATKEKGRKKT